MNIFSSTLNGAVIPYMELMHDCALNGHIYTKDNLTPVPYEWLSCATSYAYESFATKMIFLNPDRPLTSMGYNCAEDYLIPDNSDPNICYYLKQYFQANCPTLCFIKLYRGENHSYTYSAYEPNTGWYNYGWRGQYITQDAQYVYYLLHAPINNRDNVQTHFIRFTKSGNSNSIFSTGLWSTTHRVVGERGQYVYILVAWQELNNMYRMWRLDKSAWSFANYGTWTANAVNISTVGELPLISEAYKEHYYSPCQISLSDRNMTLRWWNTDLDSSSMSTGICECAFPSDYYAPMYGSTIPDVVRYICLFEGEGGKRYIVTARGVRGQSVYLGAATATMLTIFQIDPSNPKKLIFVDNKSIGRWFQGMVSMNGGQAICMADRGGVQIWAWQEAAKTFNMTTEYNDAVRHVAVDRLSNVYVLTDRNHTMRLVMGAPAEDAIVKFADEYIKLSATDDYPVESSVIIETRDSIGRLCAAKVNVSLYGPCCFEDGMKQRKVDCTASAPTVIKIIIMGPGYLNIVGNVIVGA
jgi:hypothetical protein